MRLLLTCVVIAFATGCGGDPGKSSNPGVHIEWNKSPDAPKGYGDPSKSASTGRPDKGGPKAK